MALKDWSTTPAANGAFYFAEGQIPSSVNNNARGLMADLAASYAGTEPMISSYARTAAEITAGVTPTNYQYEPGWVLRYGTNTTPGTTNMTAAIQAAITVGLDVHFSDGTYAADNLTQSVDGQRFYARGNVIIIKRANGALFTSSGDNVDLNGIGFRGDAASPTFTGDNIVMSGDHPRLINCGSRWCPGRAVLMTGQHAQIIGTCDIYQTTDASASGYDIEIGVSGTATLYHAITNIYTSQPTGGVHFIDCGGQSIVGSQIGKLFIDAGTSPAGVNGGSYSSNRINGNVTVELSSSAFSANVFSNITLTLVAGTSGHTVDDSNAFDASATITDDSNNSNVVDIRVGVPITYVPTWTGAGSNPAIGNGSITGRYIKRARMVDVTIDVVMGSTTTYGTGGWYFSLPYTPMTVRWIGSAQILDSGTIIRSGTSQSMDDSTARVIVTADSDTAQIDSARPMTWATGDRLNLSLSYAT